MTKVLATLVLGGAIIGCGATAETLKSRAAFDMNCPEHKLQITEIDDKTRGVMGCDKQATYIEQCEGKRARKECTWKKDSEVTSDKEEKK